MNPWTGLSPAIVSRPPPAKRMRPKPRPSRHPHIDNPWGLSPVQCAVMTHYTEGLTAVEVGKVLSLSPKTIEAHLHDCRKRMAIDRRIKAAIAWDRFRRRAVAEVLN